jgi:DNA polymerase III delta subunit
MSNLFSEDGDLLMRFVLLAGDDTTSRDIARDEIVAAVKKQQPAADTERYNSDNGDFAAFFERIISPSLLSPLRVFLIPNVHTLGDKELELLATLLDYDVPDACVVMETEKLRAAKRGKEAALSKKYAACLGAFEERAEKTPSRFVMQLFPMPAEYKMAEWVEQNTLRIWGRRISKMDAEHLVDLVGADTALLHSELSKIDLFLAPGDTISAGVIDKVAGAMRQSTQFELAQALGVKDMARVLEIIETVYAGSVYLPLFVGAVFRHFWSLFKIRQFAKDNPSLVKRYRSPGRQQQNDAALAIAVGAGILFESQAGRLFPAVIKPRLIDQALSFTFDQYKRIFALLADFDTGIKTGRFDDSKTGFQVFCYRIAKGE